MNRRAPNEADRLYLKTAESQFGLISFVQLQGAGLTKQAIYRRTRSGRLERYLPSVYKIAGVHESEMQPVMGAVLSAGAGAVVSHQTAAALRNLDGFQLRPPNISTPRRLRSQQGVIVHERRKGLEAYTTHIGPIPTTTVPQTLLDLAAIGHPRVEKTLDQCCRLRMINIPEMWLFLGRPELFGRPGTRRLTRLLSDRTQVRASTDSELEDLFMRIVRRYSLPIPVSQVPVRLRDGAIRLDFAYPDRKICVECDSYAWHMDRAAFERDRRRDLEMQALGWVVLRFTWQLLKWKQEYVAQQVRTHYESRAPAALL